jgi:dTDP-4-amino-4,6-dideoxygalactose transaminase
VLIGSDYPLSRDALYQELKDSNIFTRRYFYPLISDFPMYRGMPSAKRENLPVASDVSETVLCLPIYPAMEDSDVDRVIDIVVGR